MYDCIKQIEEKTVTRTGAAFARFDHFGSQSSEVSFKPYTEGGDIYKHNRYTSVPWKFCPFCGVKIKS